MRASSAQILLSVSSGPFRCCAFCGLQNFYGFRVRVFGLPAPAARACDVALRTLVLPTLPRLVPRPPATLPVMPHRRAQRVLLGLSCRQLQSRRGSAQRRCLPSGALPTDKGRLGCRRCGGFIPSRRGSAQRKRRRCRQSRRTASPPSLSLCWSHCCPGRRETLPRALRDTSDLRGFQNSHSRRCRSCNSTSSSRAICS